VRNSGIPSRKPRIHLMATLDGKHLMASADGNSNAAQRR
jgi:hypothetical protein